MNNKLLQLRFVALVTTVMCALGVQAAEAYACYTPSNTTLTFYYDNLRSSRTGTTYSLNTGYNDPGWLADGTNFDVKRVIFDPSFADARPTTTCYWFCDMSNLSDIIGLYSLNTSQVTNMSGMFVNCSSLTHLYFLDYFDTYSFYTSNVTDMMNMFAGCNNLTSIDVTRFNTAKVTNMESMFDGCSGLTSLDLASFNTAKVTTMELMFNGCSNLTTIYVDNGWSTARVSESTNMFKGCTKIRGQQGTTYNSSHVDKAYAHIDGGSANPGYLSEHPVEPYACYTSSNTTLTFYYDNLRTTRTGNTYDLNTGNNDPRWKNSSICSSVTQVVFDPSFADARPTTTLMWFGDMRKLQSITGMREYLNTSQVTHMGGMFCECEKLTSLDLSGFNTAKVTHMGMMFAYCSELTSLDLSHFNTARVTKMSDMFALCSSLTSLDLSSFNTSQVTTMADMFYGCSSLTDINMSSFNTAQLTSMSYMFYDCSSLTTLDLSCFNTSHVEFMPNMFENCSNLTTIYVGGGWSTAAVTYYDNMFKGCTSIRGGQGTTYDANHIDAAYAHIDGGTANPGYFTAGTEAYACYTPSNTTLTFFYDSWRTTRSGTTYELNTDDSDPGWLYDGTSYDVTKVVFNSSFANARPVSTYEWFYSMGNLQSITGLSYLNTENVIFMSGMFGCYSSSLKSLDLSHFNTAKVTEMNSMFSGCSGLTSLDLSNFNTAKVTSMNYMFEGCSGLTSLNLSSFNTSNVTDMSNMFVDCDAIEALDLRGFNTSKVTRMNQMFESCDNLTTIYVGNGWSTSAVTNSVNMFYGSTKIKGSKGTTYNANHVDKLYARIDGGTSRPGYLSEKLEPYACYTPSNTTLTFYYDSQRDSRTGTTYDIDGENGLGWDNDDINSSLTRVVFDPSFAGARPTSTAYWFDGKINLQSITGINYLNTSQVTNMSNMFLACYSLTSLDVSNFNTSKVTNMQYMFTYCNALTSLDVSSFNTAQVTNMRYMFAHCSALTSLDVSNFNTSKVTNMFDMFYNCRSLISLDLSSFNTAQVTNMGGMFSNCSNLTTIYAGSDWSTAALNNTSNVFNRSTKLVGGKGTTYDENHTGAEYAHIDGGPNNPGYFSEKPAYLRGDVNGDNVVNIADVTALIDYLLSGNATGINLAAANCNLDNAVNIADVTSLIDYLLSGSW